MILSISERNRNVKAWSSFIQFFMTWGFNLRRKTFETVNNHPQRTTMGTRITHQENIAHTNNLGKITPLHPCTSAPRLRVVRGGGPPLISRYQSRGGRVKTARRSHPVPVVRRRLPARRLQGRTTLSQP